MDERTRNHYLGIIAEMAPEKYREVLERLKTNPATPGINPSVEGQDVPVYGGQGYQIPPNLG